MQEFYGQLSKVPGLRLISIFPSITQSIIQSIIHSIASIDSFEPSHHATVPHGVGAAVH